MNTSNRPKRIGDIQAMKERAEKIIMLTAYAAWMARILERSGAVDMLLVGDSLGMVELGHDTTLPVTMDDMARCTQAVRMGAPNALIVADMPFLSHQASFPAALNNAGRLMRGGASGVKLEGGGAVVRTVERLVEAGIPVMGHLGLQPQSVHAQGGFRRQAKKPEEQRQLLSAGEALQNAGAFALVLECVPETLARQAAEALRIPVIGIGAGAGCDGQVLVTHDILGLSGYAPSFAKQYASLGDAIEKAVGTFAGEVRAGVFPESAGRKRESA